MLLLGPVAEVLGGEGSAMYLTRPSSRLVIVTSTLLVVTARQECEGGLGDESGTDPSLS